MSQDVLLVGSIPFDTAEQVFREFGKPLGAALKTMPDGEVGPRKHWISRIHYQVLAGKYGCSVATTHTSGGDGVVAYQNHVLNYLGIVSVGGIGVATGGDSGVVDAAGGSARALGKRLAEAIRDGYSDPAQEAEIASNREFFREIVVENRDLRTGEYERWERMGWIR